MISKPFQHKIPDSTPESLTEFHLLKLEIDKLLQKGAIEQVESLEPGSFVSLLFTVPKSNGQRRPVINLRQLNKHVYNQKFRMESLGNIHSLLKPGGFMIKIDLQDAYMSVPVAPKSRSLLVFIFEGKIYCFKVMPFGLNSAPRIFTKLFKPIVRLLRSQGMLLIINIFGRYTSNCSNSRSVPSSGQILNETTSRFGILSEHKQVSSYSHPKDNFFGFSNRLCKYDNFSPRGKTISNNSKGQSSRLACVGKSLKERGISERVSKILLSSWRSSTEKHYQSAWKSFHSWCFEKSEDPISCPVNIVLEFLTDLFDKGLQYRTINTYRSAISMTHLPLDGSLIGSYPLVSRFMKGVFQSRLPYPRY